MIKFINDNNINDNNIDDKCNFIQECEYGRACLLCDKSDNEDFWRCHKCTHRVLSRALWELFVRYGRCGRQCGSWM